MFPENESKEDEDPESNEEDPESKEEELLLLCEDDPPNQDMVF